MVLILPDVERSSVAWKNGGGLTREIAVHPPGSDLDGFDWRVSIAQVRTPGAFSSFPGVERQMAVLSGCLHLSIAGGAAIELSPASAPLAFAGDVPVHAQPAGRPVTDLNVMTRRTRCRARLSRHPPGSSRLSLDAHVTLVIALESVTLSASGSRWQLSALDAARIEGVSECEVVPHAADSALRSLCYLAEISAAARA